MRTGLHRGDGRIIRPDDRLSVCVKAEELATGGCRAGPVAHGALGGESPRRQLGRVALEERDTQEGVDGLLLLWDGLMVQIGILQGAELVEAGQVAPQRRARRKQHAPPRGKRRAGLGQPVCRRCRRRID